MTSPRAIGCLGAVAVAAVLAAPDADAHVFPDPTYVSAEGTTSLELTVPNERRVELTGFVLRVPVGLRIEGTPSSGEWSAVSTAREATWKGGRLPPFAETTFEVDLAVTQSPGTVVVDAVEQFADGESVRWPVTLLITPADGANQRLGLALVVAIVGLLVLTLAAAFLVRRGRASLQEK